jgi:hypothetical protein
MTNPGLPPPPDGLDDLVDELASLLGDERAARHALAQIRDELVEQPSTSTAERHLAAMIAAVGNPAGGAQVIDLRTRRVRRAVAGTTFGLLALGATGGLAAAGMLPPIVQDAVSRAASVLSIDLPRSTPAATIELPDTPGATAPGRTGQTPGATAPGRTGQTPGQTGQTPATTAPGRTGDTPGATAPGRTGETPGQTGQTPATTAPGRTGDTPGDTAPGQTGDTPGATAPPPTPPPTTPPTPPPTGPPAGSPGTTAPGQTGDTPGATAPGRGQGQGRGEQG